MVKQEYRRNHKRLFLLPPRLLLLFRFLLPLFVAPVERETAYAPAPGRLGSPRQGKANQNNDFDDFDLDHGPMYVPSGATGATNGRAGGPHCHYWEAAAKREQQQQQQDILAFLSGRAIGLGAR